MKTLKSIMLGLVLLVVCGAAKASNITDDKLLTKSHAISTFIDAMTRGKLEGINDVLDKTAEFSIVRGKSVLSFGKKDMLDYLESNKNIRQLCTTNTSVVESNASIAIVKVAMQYDDFTRNNYITVANTGNGWKIVSVYSVFK